MTCEDEENEEDGGDEEGEDEDEEKRKRIVADKTTAYSSLSSLLFDLPRSPGILRDFALCSSLLMR
jgi:hypothetical protein